MATQNPQIAEQLRRARAELARLKADKARLFPANPHPFVEPDRFPRDFTPEQVQQFMKEGFLFFQAGSELTMMAGGAAPLC